MKDLGNTNLWIVYHNMSTTFVIDGYKSYTDWKIKDDPECDKNILYFNIFPKQMRQLQSKCLRKNSKVVIDLSIFLNVKYHNYVYDKCHKNGDKRRRFDYSRLKVFLGIRYEKN